MVDFGLTAYVVIQGDLITWQKHQIEQIPILFMILKFVFPSWARDLKKFGKIQLGSKLSLGLIYDLSILFSTELSSKNWFDILFGGFSW